MINVILLGLGNVNTHLLNALSKCKAVDVKQIYNRSNIDSGSSIKSIPFTNNILEIGEADVYIIGIPDDAISSFSKSLLLHNKLVVHTSGGAAMDLLSKNNRRGIFYPLQTFSKQRKVDFKNIPICIEAENVTDLELLRKLGNTISKNVTEITSEERAKLHLAAVFVNNFTNYLYHIGGEILKKESLPFDLLRPLIQETALKIETLSPKDAQTGPAKRNDVKTIEKHLDLLGDSNYRKVYELFTEELKNNF